MTKTARPDPIDESSLWRFRPPVSPVVDRISHLLQICEGKRVLHLGCTDWPLTRERASARELLHQKLASSASSIVGVDADQSGVDALRELGFPETYCDNVEEFSHPDLAAQRFPLIIAGEIIEHLENPGRFLRAASRLLEPGGELVITTVNAYCAFRFVRYLAGSEMVHHDHNYYFSPRVLSKLVRRCGYSVTALYYYPIGREMRHQTAWYFRAIDTFTTRVLPAASDGLIIHAIADRS